MPNAPNLKVRLPVRPEKGAANKALLRLLSDLSGHPVQIVRGNKDRNKTVAFAASGEEFLTALKEGWLKSQAGR